MARCKTVTNQMHDGRKIYKKIIRVKGWSVAMWGDRPQLGEKEGKDNLSRGIQAFHLVGA